MAHLITFEGGDGVGKSTLLLLIKKDFKNRNIPFLTTREPGGTPIGEEIRKIILKPRQKTDVSTDASMNAITELLLYEAARAQHLKQVILPTLKSGKHVLCDRFTDSTIAYQGFARGIDIQLVKKLNDIATEGLKPQAVVWLKLSPVEALKRMSQRGPSTRFDQEKIVFHKTIFQAFLKISQAEPERFIVLDATHSPKKLFAQLQKAKLWEKLFKQDQS